jgi:hypothetical protein
LALSGGECRFALLEMSALTDLTIREIRE